jgi:hypothetical protein
MMRRVLCAGILSVAFVGCNDPQNPSACRDVQEERLSDNLIQAQKKMTDALKQDDQRARRVIQIDQKMISLLSSGVRDEARCIKAFTSRNHPEEEGCIERMKKSVEELKALRAEENEREQLLDELR